MNIINDLLYHEYLTAQLLFTPMNHSVTTLDVKLGGVRFNEEELTPRLTPSTIYPTVISAKSNFGGFNTRPAQEKTSNRGRKKNEAKVRKGKHKGTGDCFDSQIMFEVTLTSQLAHIDALVDDDDDEISEDMYGKLYKIKVFRNGSVTMPGVLQHDLSDSVQPLDDLCGYLRVYLPDIHVISKNRSMSNFKFMLVRGCIDIIKFEQYLTNLITGYYRIDIEGMCNALTDLNWPQIHRGNIPTALRAYELMLTYKTHKPKVIHCSEAVFIQYYDELPLVQLWDFMDKMKRYAEFNTTMLYNLAKAFLTPYILDMCNKISMSNMVLPVSSDEERQAAVVLRLRAPRKDKPDHETKIKIFPTNVEPQKIDMLSANSMEEAEYIYRWLNYSLQKADAIYSPHHYPAEDDEFPLE